MIEVSDFKRGVCFVYKGHPVQIVDLSLSTPTARGGATIAKVRLRNLVSGQLLGDSIRSGEKFDSVEVERSSVSYLYTDGTDYHFMDGETFEQFTITSEDLGSQVGYLTDGLEGILSLKLDGKIVSVEMPQTVVMEVVEADPVIKGATAKAQFKRAVVQTGLEVQVPGYVDVGQLIKLDTRNGHFVERVQK